jgi:hypothetical protein|tara:strand:- start:4 stop:291 length:288 start_codon:yes stop_codon:yes gene_type:complete
MSHLKIIDFASKRPKPTYVEAKNRLEHLLEDFVERGVSPKEIASLIFTFGACEVLSYSDTPEEGSRMIDEVLYNCFGIEKKSIFSEGFVTDDETE